MNLKSEKLLSIFSKILFIIYLILLIWVVIFKCNIAVSLTDGYLYLKTISLKERFLIYIIPFQNHFIDFKDFVLNDTFLNVIVFIPMGLYVSYFIKNKRFLMAFVISFGASLFLEVFQLFTLMGSYQSEDLIVNTLGGIIGYLLYKLIYKDTPRRMLILNIISLVVIVMAIPVVIYATINTIINFDLYISIVNRTY